MPRSSMRFSQSVVAAAICRRTPRRAPGRTVRIGDADLQTGRGFLPGTTYAGDMSPGPRSIWKRSMSVGDLGVVAVIFAIVAMAAFAVYRRVSQRSYDAKVRASLPIICRAAGEQRDRLTAAIASYKQTYGFFPPDHLLSTNPIVVETITNQLFYELTGCVYDRTQEVYQPSGRSDYLPRPLVRAFFGRDITNSAETPDTLRSFLPSARVETLFAIHERPQTIALLSYAPNWDGYDGDMSGFEIGTWEYNSSAPRHNPGHYDLWLEIKAAGTNILISNW
jgi:hypothetical protein